MGIFRNLSSFKYTRVDEWDTDEKKHREAQFLIYKTLQQADRVISATRKPSSKSSSWLIRFRISNLKVKIGKRFIRLRKNVTLGFSKARAGLCRQLSSRVKVWARIFQGDATTTAPAATVRLPQPLLA